MGIRADRIADRVRQEVTQLLAREVRDPRIGLITVTRVRMTPDLLLARVYYTTMGDAKERRELQRGLDRATRFIRRQLGQRLQLRRVPKVEFRFDEMVEEQRRIEQLFDEIRATASLEEPHAGSGDREPDE
jgi:ribosome-binding factor A